MDIALTDSIVKWEVYLVSFFFLLFCGGGVGGGRGLLWCLISLRIKSSLSLRNFNSFTRLTHSSPKRSLPSS